MQAGSVERPQEGGDGDVAVVDGHDERAVALDHARAGTSRAIASTRSSSAGSPSRLSWIDVARDAGLQRRRRVVGDEPAVVHDEDPVGERVGLVEVVRA